MAGFGFRVDARLRKWLVFTAGPTGPAMGAVGRLLFFMGVLLRGMQHSGGAHGTGVAIGIFVRTG